MDRTDAARDIVSASASRLCLDMRFLTRAVLSLSTDVEEGEGAPRCDGRTVIFYADTVIGSFREDPNSVTRDLAHCVLHCVLGHSSPANPPEADLAEDMLVEYVLDCLDTPHTSVPGRDDRMFVCQRLFAKAGAPAPDLLSQTVAGTSHWQMDLHRRMFVRDDHSSRPGADGDVWRELSQQVMVEIEGFIKDDEGRTSALMHILRIRNRRRYDYRSFLRKFMVSRTTVRESQTEFDPIYYTYGLSHYGNLPLIDSLEQSDSGTVEEFVIAVDTSGSTMKGPVVRFLGGSAKDAKDFDNDASMIERVIDDIRDECVFLAILVDEAGPEMLDAKLSRYDHTAERYDASEIRAEVKGAEKLQKQMRKDARKALRESKKNRREAE